MPKKVERPSCAAGSSPLIHAGASLAGKESFDARSTMSFAGSSLAIRGRSLLGVVPVCAALDPDFDARARVDMPLIAGLSIPNDCTI
jgi:hypothetical protein